MGEGFRWMDHFNAGAGPVVTPPAEMVRSAQAPVRNEEGRPVVWTCWTERSSEVINYENDALDLS